jgi:hypothetical protein
MWVQFIGPGLLSEPMNSIVPVQSIKSNEFTQNSMKSNNEQMDTFCRNNS